jgi:hypothetical protein
MSLRIYRMTVSQNTFSKSCSMFQDRGTLMSEKHSRMLSAGNVHRIQQVMDLLSFSYLMQPSEQMLQR